MNPRIAFAFVAACCPIVATAPVCAAETTTTVYPDLRPAAHLRMPATDHGPVLLHGDAPDQSDTLGARDAWVWEHDGKYYMHYDAAGPKGWLTSLAESDNLKSWTIRGPVLDLGTSGTMDSAAACYGTTYFDGSRWHMFYLGTPNATPPPDRIPSLPYVTMKATAPAPTGPWTKQPDIEPFRPKPGTYYRETASPGHILKHGADYLQYFSAAVVDENRTRRTLGIARTRDLNAPWTVDPHPILPLEEQIENASIYFEPANNTWFLFTNHVSITEVDGGEFTDAIWVYWTKDPTYWDARNKAVVLDGQNCKWASRCIGLPSVVKKGDKLALFYDAPKGDSTGHMGRDIGLAWLDLPLQPPAGRLDANPAVVSGLDIIPDRNQIHVTPGVAKIAGSNVTISTTKTLTVPPHSIKSVRGEQWKLTTELPHAWTPGTHLRETLTANQIPYTLLGDSVKVRAADGHLFTRDKDYKLDVTWAGLARTTDGAITTDTPVLVEYDYSLLRIDGIDVAPDGNITLVQGEPNLVCPVPAPATTGSLRLANIYRPYAATTVEPWHVFVIGPVPGEPDIDSHALKATENTVRKLKAGEPVTIVTWGDSVTVGGDTTKPELAYANQFIIRLKQRYPNAKITHHNAAIGGTNTEGRLPAFEQEVLAHKPDLVTIEYVNDMGFPISLLQKNWDNALTRIKAAGAEAVVITPHFTAPFFMGNQYPRGTEIRPQVRWLKIIADRHNVGLADTSKRWENLETQGIPYQTLLYNGLNHPNDFGHELFVKDLMNLFPE